MSIKKFKKEEKIFARQSKIHGTGLFIAKDANKNSLIAHLKGKLSVLEKNLFHTPKGAAMHPDWVAISMSQWIDPKPPFKYLNHSCDPSCGVKGKVSLYSLRKLKAGDEITIDYSTIEVDPFWKMKCCCGSRNCRKIIRSVEYLPKATFRKYYPYLPTIFRRFYMRKVLGVREGFILNS